MNQFAPCPKCLQTDARQLNFTWWGGALGPKLFTHVKCEACGTKFNGRTGQSNNVKIVVYSLVTGIIFFVLFTAIFAFWFTK